MRVIARSDLRCEGSIFFFCQKKKRYANSEEERHYESDLNFNTVADNDLFYMCTYIRSIFSLAAP